jgi:hypothetical protein
MSDWELVKHEEPGFFKSLGQGYLNYAGGALRGMGQSIGDLGASALNAPISLAEYASGHKIPHVPHPNLVNQHPGSFGESLGQNLGQLAGGLALPGGAGMKAAQLAGKGYQALRGGEQLPLIARLLAGGAGGAAEGALGNEENRTLGAELGGLLGTAGHAIPQAINFAKSMSSKNIAKHVTDEINRLKENFNQRFTSHLEEGERAGANDFLNPQNGNIKLLKKAGETGQKKGEKELTYALQKYNQNPNLTNAHYAQRDLGKIERLHKDSVSGTLESDAYKEALKLKNRLLQQISNSFEKSGAKEHGLGYQQARTEYAKEFAPYSDTEAINNLLGKNKLQTQTLRPEKFADVLLKDEDFLSRVGKKHEGLLRREKFNALKKNKLAQGAAMGAGSLAAGFLPYEIAKLLGLI